MKPRLQTNTVARNASAVSGLLVGLLIGSCFGSTVVRSADDGLTIARQGNFFIGGKYVESNRDTPMIGHAFVRKSSQRYGNPVASWGEADDLLTDLLKEAKVDY
jgi:hypothetical protein